MVTVYRKPALSGQYSDLPAWVASVAERCANTDQALLTKACATAQRCEEIGEEEGTAWPYGIGCFRIGLEMVDILADLKADGAALPAALLYRSVREERLPLEQVEKEFGSSTAQLIEGVLRMAAIGAIVNPSRKPVLGQQEGQLSNVRKMLVGLIDDVRVALLKLAERTVILHALVDAEPERQRKVAIEVFDIYAPLAHRLGVGQLKWELEDIAFRFLQPGAYKRIASLLDERRVDREKDIEAIIELLKQTLTESGIEDVEVTGRVKHIYSIWRKMQKKQLDFYEVHDVRAVRIMVPEVRDCYAALGIVHGLWAHVPKEFDDYIASPKDNGYQSLHTAVVGPGRKMLEVQIRTHQMHEEAELGVSAHWHYKEGGKRGGGDYEQKIAWLREVLEWHDTLGAASLGNMVEDFRSHDGGARVYVFTPKGHVVDLENGATPVDMAYQIHTEVGHRCRGAKVNGRIVPLSYKLKTGEQVEIITTKEGGPSRDWLSPSLGYVHTASARAKVQHWFKRQSRDTHIAQGKAALEKELSRLALPWPGLDKIAAHLNLVAGDDVLAALGSGDLRMSQVLNQIQPPEPKPSEQQELELSNRKPPKSRGDGVSVFGLGNIKTQLAACCRPVPGDSIMGYITVGRGVTVHRSDCNNLLAMQGDDPARTIEVTWGEEDAVAYPVDIFLRGRQRSGLLKDVASVFANDNVPITAAHTEENKSDHIKTMLMTVEVNSLNDLGRLLSKLDQVPGMLEVRRYKH